MSTDVVKAVSIVETPALNILEYFGTESSGDTRLSACVASATERCGQAFQQPEFDEYVLVTAGRIELVRSGSQKTTISRGEGVLLKAGESVTWTWPEACQYVIICLPSSLGMDGCLSPHSPVEAAPSLATSPDSVYQGDLLQAAVDVGPGAAMNVIPEAPPLLAAEFTDVAASSASGEASAPGGREINGWLQMEEESLTPEPSAILKPRSASTGSLNQAEDMLERAEALGSTTESVPTNGASTPINKNLPDYMSNCGDLMQRASSLSAFDQLLDTKGLVELRSRLEAEERPVRYGARHLSTSIVVVSSEIHPWSKTGGLAMVAGSYAYEFAMRGHRTMAVSPFYGKYENCRWIGKARVWLNGCDHEVSYFHQRQEYGDSKGCDFVFVDHVCFHRPEGLYGDPQKGGEYEDNLFRFSLLTVAATEAPLVLELGGSTYGQDVCFIANDWQTGLLPVYLLYKYKRNNTYRNARCMMVLHNMGYQGKYRKHKYPCDQFLGLPHEAEKDLQGEDLNYGADCINLLGAGIRLADRVITVSPNYALEMQTPEGGHGLHQTLKEKAGRRRLVGILNGISDEWNPTTDPHIPQNFSSKDFEEGKRRCKSALQHELGLTRDPAVALIGFCGRLCYQKGVHLITEILPWLMTDTGNGVNGRVQMILMGKGDQGYENQLRDAETKHKGKVCGYVGFKAEIEHRMMAGCDILLMPSQYEPCGLPQMYAQQYATLPVVHETGGLKDSVNGLWDESRNAGTATGFLFNGFDKNKLMERLYQSLDVFHHKKWLWKRMQQNAIESDYYWPQAVDEYERHIDFTLEEPPSRS